MTTTDTKRIQAGYEPIPGYVLEVVLGRGGFGEVWRASAPGGLKKAVKFVFGTQDQSRAARELKSLERIKGVQHPFLLTLERFEAIDDQLVIVTELADCSLEDVFKEHHDHGSCGIPREILISHLHDTADALDYLHVRYQLQHMDIKPANLLLVGGHVKVADFGLLKDLREAECSIVGGLTPIYAPPEIFDGRPSMHSDQYSLAVMYQELLTGTRPFSGRTIAQLATQHVHSAPNLEPLPPSDRPVVAKALEKDPERRFESCQEFVEALKNVRGKSLKRRGGGEGLVSSDTQFAVDGIGGSADVEDLPQISTSTASANEKSQHHAVVIALGGTGAECLQELRRRVADLGADSPVDLHSVLIDTDMSTTYSMKVGEVSDRVPRCRVIHTPLRSAHEYRQNGTDRLRTISRRWIYNVPRSGSTEGMRPLGRLALVDHGPMVKQELDEALEELADAAGESTPSIYVVGSLAGGTGSGMYIDVVHLLRHLLDESGHVETPILSLLSTASMRGNPSNPVALHDAQAAITEIQHYLKAGNGYPGDAGAEWPSVPAARTPLRDVYLIEETNDRELAPHPIEVMTDYIWSDATGAGELLVAARQLQLEKGKESSISLPSVRTVGVVPLGDSKRLERRVLGPVVVRELLIQWLGLPSKARRDAIPLADRVSRRVDLDAVARVDETYVDESQQQLVDNAIAPLDSEARNDNEALWNAIQPLAGELVASNGLPSPAAGLIKSLHRELSVGLGDRRADITTVIECLKLIREKCVQKIATLRSPCEVTETAETASIAKVAARAIASYHIERLMSGLKNFQDRLEQCATTLAMAIVQVTQLRPSESNPWDEMPAQAKSQFDSIVGQLHDSSANRYLVRWISDRGVNVDAETMVHELIETTVPLLKWIVEENREALLQSDCEDDDTCDGCDSVATVASSAFRQADSHSQTAVTQAMQFVKQTRANDEPLSVDEAVIAVKPALLAFGGLQRLLLVVGADHERSRLEPQVRDACDGKLTVAVIPGATPKLIHEAQQIELNNLLSRLTVLNGGNAQVTGRLSSRTDVNW